MQLRIISLTFFIIHQFTSNVFSQATLKDIVLTYDLHRKVQKDATSGYYNIDKGQLVHIEPICGDMNQFGSFCGVVLEMDKRKGKGGGKVSLLSGRDKSPYYYLKSDPIISEVNDTTYQFALQIFLTTEKGCTTRPIAKIPDSFRGRLKGKRMDVKIHGGAREFCLESESPESEPWVCKFVFN